MRAPHRSYVSLSSGTLVRKQETSEKGKETNIPKTEILRTLEIIDKCTYRVVDKWF